jgi:hypothetical protein
MITPVPSLYSYEVEVYRKSTAIDSEGTPLRQWDLINQFRGGFGVPGTSRQIIEGYAGQRIDASVSTEVEPQALVGDKVSVAGREWKVVGVKKTPITYRILLADWGAE